MSTVLIKMNYKYVLASLIQDFISPIFLAVLLRGEGAFLSAQQCKFFFGGGEGELKDLEDMLLKNVSLYWVGPLREDA